MKQLIKPFSWFLVILPFIGFSQSLRYADKIRIHEAMLIADRYGETLFKGYNKAPFAIVLITDSSEFLINHPNPSVDFTLLGHDELLNSNIYYRKRQFDIHFLASFPAVNGLACIVAGTPENTGKNSSEWIITLLHEHFHQYQYSFPDYQQAISSLQLAGDDKTGMWMLNYPFPYESAIVLKQYELYSNALYKAAKEIGTNNYMHDYEIYLNERNKLKAVLSPADYRYLSFQIWQEGLARNTEYCFLQKLVDYTPSKEVISLPDFVPFSAIKSRMYDNEMNGLHNNKLNEVKRVCFYSVGFAEGLVLDKQNPAWRKQYMLNKFYIEKYR